MCINENQEFEAINQKAKERTVNVEEFQQTVADTYREVKARRKAKAIGLMVVSLLAFVAAVFGITGLEVIGWINDTFRIVLMCLAGSVAMFKVGYFWHEFKN